LPYLSLSSNNNKTDSLIRLIRSGQKDSMTVNNCIKIIGSLAFTEHSPEVAKIGHEVLKFVDGIFSYPEGRVKVRLSLAGAYRTSGDSTKMRQVVDDAIMIARGMGNEKLLVDALSAKARTLIYDGFPADALIYLREAEQKAIRNSMTRDYALILNHIGEIYWKRGELSKAIECVQKSATICEKIRDFRWYAYNLMAIGVISTELKKYDEALTVLRKAIHMQTNNNMAAEICGPLINIADVFIKQSKFDSALVYTNRAIKVSEDTDDQIGVGIGFNYLGKIFLEKGQYRQSEDYLLKSLGICREMHDKTDEAGTLNTLCKLYEKQNDPIKMERFISDAIRLSREIEDSLQLKENYLTASLLYSKKGDYEKAYRNRLSYDSLNSKAFNSENNEIVNELMAKYELKSKEKENDQLHRENIMSAKIIEQQKLLFYVCLSGLPLGLLLIFFIVRGHKLKSMKYQLQLRAQEIELLELDRKNKNVEKEKLQTELQFLKAQINPHFLFNALNSIYVLMDDDKQMASDTLLKFSSLLRYQLYDCNSNVTTIEKEMEFINNYILLEKVRNSDYLEVVTEFSNQPGYLQIAPFVLIPFVENAFKHVSHFTDQPNRINIRAYFEDITLFFHVTNTCDEKIGSAERVHKGIGLINVKRRLELLYPEKHNLEVRENGQNFSIFLTLKLSIKPEFELA
jgi:tetratricopeptide (TPR) repeat protein